jgi:hypothetical protein
MKSIFTIIIFFTLSFGFSQNGELSGIITERNIEKGFPGLTVELINNGKVIFETQTDFDGKYNFKNIPLGTYSMEISGAGMRKEAVENIEIKTQHIIINYVYPNLCVANKKICPKGHSDNIIPIVYGLPTKKLIKKAENKKVILGGCALSYEKWHCVEHNLDF